jgi:limonene-1,2-epoxide hydrolase
MASEQRDPQATVERFLELLRTGDIDAAGAMLAPNVTYANVGLITVTGRSRALRVLRAFVPRGSSFDVEIHAIASSGSTVLTERTDTISRGRLRVAFWVCGRFEVEGGEIALWRDYFDYGNVTAGLLRGLAGAVLPPR